MEINEIDKYHDFVLIKGEGYYVFMVHNERGAFGYHKSEDLEQTINKAIENLKNLSGKSA